MDMRRFRVAQIVAMTLTALVGVAVLAMIALGGLAFVLVGVFAA